MPLPWPGGPQHNGFGEDSQGLVALRDCDPPDVGLGSKADVTLLNFDVRFTPNSGHPSAQSQCPLWAMYGRRPRCKRNLTFCEAFGCSHVSGLFSNGGVTSIAMQPLWLLALM